MKNILFKKSLILSTVLVAVLGFVSVAFAQTDTISEGFNVAQNIGEGALGTTDIRTIIVNVVNVALGFLGIVAVIILMYGGYLWMTSGGNQERVDSAKKTIRNAVIGLLIIIASWAIVFFAVNQLFRATGGTSGLGCVYDPNPAANPTRACGPGNCGFQTCQPGDTWGSCNTSACTGGGSGNFLITYRYPQGAINAPICVGVQAQFNQDVQDASINDATDTGADNVYLEEYSDSSYTTVITASVPGVASSLNGLGVDSPAIVFRPTVDLNANSFYRMNIISNSFNPANSVRSLLTNATLSNGDDFWNFTTGATGDPNPPFVVPPTTPQHLGTNICLETYLSAPFNEVMNPLTFAGAVSVNNQSGGTVPSYNEIGVGLPTPASPYALVASPNAPHASNNTYDVTIAGTVEDACGNSMGTPYGGPGAWQFDTGATLRCLPQITGVFPSAGFYDAPSGIVAVTGNYLSPITGFDFGNNASGLSSTCLDTVAPYSANQSCFIPTGNPLFTRARVPAGSQVNTGAQDGPIRISTPAGSGTTQPFDVQSPFIRSISSGRVVSNLPAASIDQFISLLGNDFGTTPGQVWFTEVGNPSNRVQAVLACGGTTGWQQNQIIVTPPNGMAPVDSTWDIQVEIQVSGNTRRSNLGQIWFDAFGAGPGLCSFVPPTATPGPVNTAFGVIGENFESMNSGSEKVQFGIPGNALDAVGNPPTINQNFSGTQDQALGLSVPSVQPQNGIGVFITDGNLYSNSLAFDVTPGAAIGPVILDYTPGAGGVGQYITITGRDFGSIKGKVYFYQTPYGSPQGVGPGNVVLGDFTSFPLACQGNLWTDTQIIVKAPNDPGFSNGNYYIAVEDSNTIIGNTENLTNPQFNNNGNAPTPGICLINPPNDAIGGSIDIFGDNFGVSPDTVQFFNASSPVRLTSATTPPVGAWNSSGQQISGTQIPVGAETGPVFVEVGGVLSNPYNFIVGLCTDAVNPANACSNNYTCCSSGQFDGQCRLDLPGGFSSCTIQQQQSLQSWTFRTGVGVGAPCQSAVDANGVPLPVPPNICVPNNAVCSNSGLVCAINSCTCQQFGVVENNSCGQLGPSPSPADDDRNACVNSMLNIQFNDSLDTTTISRIVVEYCSDGEPCQNPLPADQSMTPTPAIGLLRFPYQRAVFNDSVVIYPAFNQSSVYLADAWYRVTIPGGPSGVLSAAPANIPLPQDYVWKFKTEPTGTPCQPDQCSWSPLSVDATTIGQLDVFALGTSYQCRSIYGVSPFNINIDDTSVATVQPTSITNAPNLNIQVTAQRRGNTRLRATSINDPSLTCSAAYNVDTTIPTVISSYPNCSSSCINAAIGAGFSAGINTSDFTPWNAISNPSQTATIKLRECTTTVLGDPCTPVQLVSLSPSSLQFDGQGGPTTRTFTIDPSGLLAPDTRYEVELLASSLRSASNEPLTPNSTNGLGQQVYRWDFITKATGSGLCVIDHIEILPANATVHSVGKIQNFTGAAYGAPDACSPVSGQRLFASSYSWTDPVAAPDYGWSSQFTQVADHTRLGTAPGGLVDTAAPSGLVDASQPFIAVGTDTNCSAGTCATEIRGAVDPGPGELPISCTSGGPNKCAQLTLVCGYSSDQECSNINGNDPQIGVGSNTCCGLRPQFLPPASPPDGATGQCRNLVVTIPFNQQLDQGSLVGNVYLARASSGACAPGENSLLAQLGNDTRYVQTIASNPIRRLVDNISNFIRRIFVKDAGAQSLYTPGTNLCIIPSSLSLDPSGMVIQVAPQGLLDRNTQYHVVILGDDDPADGRKVGIVSTLGISMNAQSTTFTRGNITYSAEILTFTTGPTACTIDHIDHLWYRRDPATGGVDLSTRRDATFFCARDDCPEDIGGFISIPDFPGNQYLLSARALSSSNTILNLIDYQYTPTGPQFFDLCTHPNANFGQACVGASSPVPQGQLTHVIVDDAFPGYSKDAKGRITLTAQNTAPGLATNRISKTFDVQLFVCENPWPSVDTFPYTDTAGNCLPGAGGSCPNTSFDFYYCRDAGGPGTNDDLPALEYVRPVVSGTNNNLICYGGSTPGVACATRSTVPDPTQCACQQGDPNCSVDGICDYAGLKDLVFPRELQSTPVSNFAMIANSTAQQGGVLQVGSYSGPAPNSVTGFKLYWGYSSGNYQFSQDLGSNPLVTISNLNPTRDYYFNMTTYRLNGARQETTLNPALEKGPVQAIDLRAPNLPSNITLSSPAPGQLQIQWTNDVNTETDIATYELEVGTQSGVFLQTVDMGNVETYTLSLSPQTQYFVRLNVLDSSGNSRTSIQYSATTQ